MAHFAKLNIENRVIQILVVDNIDITNSNNEEDENIGIEYLKKITGWSLWKKTSYNTRGGKYYNNTDNTLASDQSKAFRKNFAAIGYTYDETRDAFIEPKPYDSWTLNETTCVYDPPVAKPTDDNLYEWNEETTSWDLINSDSE
tara:strand:+ start:818 stop:1249 length:432 start_codon:yes stop_codon:yes gene_type:complete